MRTFKSKTAKPADWFSRLCLFALLPLCWFGATNALRAAGYTNAAGSFGVETTRFDWHDTRRNRGVPVKIYYPAKGTEPFSIILFSHGLGGSSEGYEYLGKAWASHGFVSVHVQHLGSDDALWKGLGPGQAMESLRKAAANVQNAIARPYDISFALDSLEALAHTNKTWKERLDLQHVGAAGHSFGAYTTLAVAGQTFLGPTGDKHSFLDKRIKAAVAMSTPALRNSIDVDESYASVHIPCLHMTGSRDTIAIGNSTAEDRRVPFDHLKHSDQYLLTFKDGDHMLFSGRGAMAGGEHDAEYQPFVVTCSLAFWDAYLRDNAEGKKWLQKSFPSLLGERGTFEVKEVSTLPQKR